MHQKLLEEMGFVLQSAEDDTVEFSSIPEVFAVEDIPHFLQQWLTQTAHGTVHAFSQRDVMARSLASQRSISTGRNMETHEQLELIHKLLLCKEPDRTPEGRATFRVLATHELDRFFNP
jgi:DNA mismatch repair protein MutL